MSGITDLSESINLLLCMVILLLGYVVYRREERISAFLIGIAFGFFGLSHLSVMLGMALPGITFLLMRICGYILVAAALWLLYSEPPESMD